MRHRTTERSWGGGSDADAQIEMSIIWIACRERIVECACSQPYPGNREFAAKVVFELIPAALSFRASSLLL